MGFDAATDALVDALRVVVGANVNAALAERYGREPIAVTYGYPIPLDQLPSVQLPALSVYRVSTALKSTGRRTTDRRTVFALDYFAAPVPQSNLDAEWAVLHEVWNETIDAICADSFSACAEVPPKTPDAPLTEAGVLELVESSVQATFSFAQGGQGAFPFFAGRATLDWRPDPAPSTAVLFRELLGSFRLYDGTAPVDTECDPVVQVLITNTGFDRGFTLGFGPPEA